MRLIKERLTFLVIVFAAMLASSACGGDKKAIGEPCVTDRECDNGFCLDLSVVDSECRGKICTRGCQQEGDCPEPPAGRDCIRFGGRSLCFYDSWRQQRCGE